jgi:multidrug efflux pump subunit AcrA (membrane-fusion protein)|tara:strand:+ start:243 stop:944 length:702 start_codon:yes stop_codon:yes gene_type:complete
MSKASSKFFLAITSLFVLFFFWMLFAKVDITTQAIGIVVPEKNITKLGTMVTGEIVAVNYKQGDIVKKGDTIITINPGVGYEPRHIVANIDGRIQELTYKNPGSVVKQGDGLAILVPLDQKLIVQGRLLVKDRGYVAVGMEAKIRLANQDQLKFDSINAKIISISPDANQSSNAAWYDIELEIDKEVFESGDITYTLVPGIHVLVFILTGERTVLSYITTPFHNGIGQALQER